MDRAGRRASIKKVHHGERSLTKKISPLSLPFAKGWEVAAKKDEFPS